MRRYCLIVMLILFGCAAPKRVAEKESGAMGSDLTDQGIDGPIRQRRAELSVGGWHVATKSECDEEAYRELVVMGRAGLRGDPPIQGGSMTIWSEVDHPSREDEKGYSSQPCGRTDGHGQFRTIYTIRTGEIFCEITQETYASLWVPDVRGDPIMESLNHKKFETLLDKCRIGDLPKAPEVRP